jgi:hypothetical protein
MLRHIESEDVRQSLQAALAECEERLAELDAQLLPPAHFRTEPSRALRLRG